MVSISVSLLLIIFYLWRRLGVDLDVKSLLSFLAVHRFQETGLYQTFVFVYWLSHVAFVIHLLNAIFLITRALPSLNTPNFMLFFCCLLSINLDGCSWGRSCSMERFKMRSRSSRGLKHMVGLRCTPRFCWWYVWKRWSVYCILIHDVVCLMERSWAFPLLGRESDCRYRHWWL